MIAAPDGVSHMLPFVVGGGILIALAFLLDDYSIDPKNFGSNTPTAKFFKDIGGAAFGFMLPVLAGFISMSIADRPGLAVGFVGGALAGTTGSGFLRAPHGGIFVVPTIGNPAMYLLAIVIGAIVGCAILSVLKKPLKENA